MARIILLFFGAAIVLLALLRLRAYRLKERYMILFALVGLPFWLLAIWPSGIGWIGDWLHIEYRTVSVLCLAAFLLVMIVELFTIVSLQDRRIATLAQIVGILMEKQGINDRSTALDAADFTAAHDELAGK